MHIGGQCANPLVYFVCQNLWFRFGKFFQQITEFWKMMKLSCTKLMMNPINIQKLRILFDKILLNFDDDGDEDEEFCML
jgi:hypothetical protein